VFKQAEAKLAGSDVLATWDAEWHAGVVGLAAGRLARKHGRPAAVGFIIPDGTVRVSLRGTPGFHIGDLLNACSEHLEGFGGHAGAGGGSIKQGAWDEFVSAFGAAIEGQAVDVANHLEQSVDGILGLGAMHAGLAERLARFEPLGRGNPPCSWLLKDVYIADRRDMKGGVSRLKVGDGSRWLDCIIFGANGFSQPLQPGCAVSLLGQLQLDDYRGGGAVQFVVEDALVSSW
jgi:single-stranded-DNA-specific exonuclease